MSASPPGDRGRADAPVALLAGLRASDVVLIEAGDRIGADMRLTDSRGIFCLVAALAIPVVDAGHMALRRATHEQERR